MTVEKDIYKYVFVCIRWYKIYSSMFMTRSLSINSFSWSFFLFLFANEKKVQHPIASTSFSFFFILHCQIFVEALYYSYDMVKTEVERQGSRNMYIYSHTSIHVYIHIYRRYTYILTLKLQTCSSQLRDKVIPSTIRCGS